MCTGEPRLEPAVWVSGRKTSCGDREQASRDGGVASTGPLALTDMTNGGESALVDDVGGSEVGVSMVNLSERSG